MYTLKDLRKWACDIGKFASPEQNIEVKEGILVLRGSDDMVEACDTDEGILRFVLYTNENSYQIVGSVSKYKVQPEPSENYAPLWHTYLGCVASSRTPRAGEDWTRGNDLADGSLTPETWASILGDIVSYELVKVHRKEG